MKIANLYNKGKPIFSLEVFPPKNGESLNNIYETIDKLISFNPGFVSVTGGALGSARGGTIAIAANIKKKYGIESVVHFTCVAKSKQDVENLLMEMKYSGIENVLALRGDPPKGQKNFIPHPEGHKYASELVEQIVKMNNGIYLSSLPGEILEAINFGIAVAGYPEGHNECISINGEKTLKEDLENLKIKVDKGADYIVTQMFLDTNVYLKFVENARKLGINIPIIPGVMPLEKYSQVTFILKQMGISIEKKFKEILDTHKDDEEYIKKVCEDHIMSMCRTLIENGAPGIQFFTMNKSEGTKKILERLL
ncbi:methylenetetrahydrofolate reductase [Candidatus Desantisbacteria bacterium]|nr:methylenetetrahydrofolate reductase [Candidatus Desantisbacteria bacterium]